MGRVELPVFPGDATTRTRDTTPADFPVAWAEPDDASLAWTLDRMHWPAQVTPLTGEYIDLFLVHCDLVMAELGTPAQMRSRRINTYHYHATAPLPLSNRRRTNGYAAARPGSPSALGSMGEQWETEFLPEIERLWPSGGLRPPAGHAACAAGAPGRHPGPGQAPRRGASPGPGAGVGGAKPVPGPLLLSLRGRLRRNRPGADLCRLSPAPGFRQPDAASRPRPVAAEPPRPGDTRRAPGVRTACGP